MALAAREESLVHDLQQRLGGDCVVADAADRATYESDWRQFYQGRALCGVLPRTTAHVIETVKLCAAAGIPVVPQGGRTGLVGGAIPDQRGNAVVINLSRMNKLRALDPLAMTLSLDAGATLAAARAEAAEAGLSLPILLGSEGSAQIGGLVATNAGGSNALRYGMTRDLVLGLEVVLPDGRLWDGMRRLRKDNAGYSLRQLFIGSEGTLGIVTGAVLQLHPAARQVATALCGVRDIAAALDVLARLRAAQPDALVACEYMSADMTALVARHRPALAKVLFAEATDCVLLEFASADRAAPLQDALLELLGECSEAGLVTDATLAANEGQRRAMWDFREAVSFAQSDEGYSAKNDVSVPIGAIPALLSEGAAAVAKVAPFARPICYGHLGDGNIHFNFSPRRAGDDAVLRDSEGAISTALNRVVIGLGGSFSAEHGIGQSKQPVLAQERAGVEIDLMRALKSAIDPRGIMNPGKIF